DLEEGGEDFRAEHFAHLAPNVDEGARFEGHRQGIGHAANRAAWANLAYQCRWSSTNIGPSDLDIQSDITAWERLPEGPGLVAGHLSRRSVENKGRHLFLQQIAALP